MGEFLITTSKEKIPSGWHLVETFDSAIRELFFVRHPKLKEGEGDHDSALAEFIRRCGIKPVYILYPWRKMAVETLPANEYYELRVARNRFAIESEEQAAYRSLSIGIAGLSVGSAVLSACTISGGPQRIKIADFDVLQITNLNRIHATLLDVGSNKTTIAMQRALELDPYLQITQFPEGLHKDNLEDFFDAEPKLDVCIDEMDSLPMKVLLRQYARKRGVPVLMATDNGDGALIDIERYDEDATYPSFHNLAGDIDAMDIESVDFRTWLSLATKIVGPEYLTDSMRNSILKIGSEISSVPQIGTAANIAGSSISYVLRRIATGDPMPSGRYQVLLDTLLDTKYQENATQRENDIKAFKEKFGA